MEKATLRAAEAALKDMGLTTPQAVRLFLVNVACRRELPFRLSAETPEDELLQSPTRRAEILESFYEDETR